MYVSLCYDVPVLMPNQELAVLSILPYRLLH
jgi:hypothetical protein